MMKKVLAPVLAALGAVLTITTLALAEPEFVVAQQGAANISVTAQGGYHVNKEYPWSVWTRGDKAAKVDKKFEFLGESEAKVNGLGKGSYTVKGAVCNGPKCLPFTKDIDVK